MALEGLPQQQTEFNLHMAEAMLGVMRQESIMRQAKLDQMQQYLLQLYERRHAEKEAARRQHQALGMRMGAMAAAAFAPALLPAAGAGAAGAGAAVPSTIGAFI